LQEIIIKRKKATEAQKKKLTRKKATCEKPSTSYAGDGTEAMDGDGGLVRTKEQEPTGDNGTAAIETEDGGRSKRKRVRSVRGLLMDEATQLGT
jgi:hypothetical protein